MNKRLITQAATAVLLLLFFMLPSAPARGQDIGLHPGRRGRRVGRVTLPTPPFNPDAGILGGRKGRGHISPKSTPRPKTRRLKATKRNTNPRTTRKRVRKRQ